MALVRVTTVRRHQRYGVRTVYSDTVPDLMTAWGYDDARDRLFQMDLSRRFAAGRLAELLGPAALGVDRRQRELRLAAAAREALRNLPAEHRGWLEAYSDGVNRRIARRPAALEHLLLRMRMEAWRPEDSLLLMLGLAQQLALDIAGERSRAVLEATLPAEVVAFLLPRGDEFAEEGDEDPALPVAALAAVAEQVRDLPVRPVVELSPTGASNCWVVGGARTRHGGPILANDMHFATVAPNVFRRVDLCLAGRPVRGFAIPGLPVVACGSNGDVAWGVANIPADYTRLVPVRSEEIEQIDETIAVRGAEPVVHRVAVAEAGPVLAEPLLGQRVVLQWAAFRPGYLGLGWVRLLEATSAAEAADVVTSSGGLPLAVLAADRAGALVRTAGGRFPRRDQHRLLAGNEDPARLPRLDGGPGDVLVTANDPPRLLPGQAEVGRNYPTSYRRARIHQLLTSRADWDEVSVAAVQEDARAGLLDFYLPHAREGAQAAEPAAQRGILAALDAWDGSQAPGTHGSALLWAFRVAVQQELMSRLLRGCVRVEPSFVFAWRNPEPVVRRLLRDRPPELAGLLGRPQERTDGWLAFLADRVQEAAVVVVEAAGKPIDRVRWDDIVSVEAPHLLGTSRWTAWLNLSPLPPVGGPESVAAYAATRGPVQRLVVSPGRERDGLAGMLGGQSGNPLSPHYRDQHRDWRRGRLGRLAVRTPWRRR